MLLVNVLIGLTIIVLSYLFWKCHKVFFIRRMNTLPGPKTWPFIGTYDFFLSRNGKDKYFYTIKKLKNVLK